MSFDADAEKVRANLLRVLSAGQTRLWYDTETLTLTVSDVQNRYIYRQEYREFTHAPLILDIRTNARYGLSLEARYTYYDTRGKPTRFTQKLRASYSVRDNVVRYSLSSQDDPLRGFLAKARSAVSSRRKAGRIYRPRSYIFQRPGLSPAVETKPFPYRRYHKEGTILRYNTPEVFNFAYYRTWAGVRTPNYGALRRAGKLPVNNFGLYTYKVNQNTYWFYEQNAVTKTDLNVQADKWFGVVISEPAQPSHLSLADSKAIKRLIAKSESDVEANIAQDVAQIGQTTRTITDVAGRLAKSIGYLKKHDISSAIGTLWQNGKPRFRKGHTPTLDGDLANNWLALQYGWKPLLQDVRGSMEALARYNIGDTAVRSVRASATVRIEEGGRIQSNQSVPTVTGAWRKLTRSQCKYIIRYKTTDHLKAYLAQTGFTNPISLLWEVLPYSFVVDWFLPIGPYLETLGSWDGLTFMDGCKVQFTRQDYEAYQNFSGTPNAHPDRYWEVWGSASKEAVLFHRTKLTAFPSGIVPSFKNGVSVTHSLNALALLRTVFGAR